MAVPRGAEGGSSGDGQQVLVRFFTKLPADLRVSDNEVVSIPSKR
jgi:hypothetical protein